MAETTLRAYVASHPRLLGALFLVALLLVETQPVLGGVAAVANHGP